MIELVSIKNIRSLEDVNFSFGNLNILSGLNSSGKSTLIGIINLLNQMDNNRIYLNGEYCNFGTVESLLYKSRFKFGVDGEVTYKFRGKEPACIKVEDPKKESDKKKVSIENSCYEDLKGLSIRYLSSDRITPSWTYSIENSSYDDRNIGPRGENTVSYISQVQQSDELSIRELRHASLEGKQGEYKLLQNITAWLGVISPGIILSAEHMSDINASKLSFGFSDDSMHSPFSVGFGLTHCLPIITMLLTAKPGDILVIENPELNLHPEGQIQIGKLICLAASNDVQVIVETHSDHIINASRISIKKGIISSDSVNISHFYQEVVGVKMEKRIASQVDKIELLENGKIKNAPKGFFDTWEKSLMELI